MASEEINAINYNATPMGLELGMVGDPNLSPYLMIFLKEAMQNISSSFCCKIKALELSFEDLSLKHKNETDLAERIKDHVANFESLIDSNINWLENAIKSLMIPGYVGELAETNGASNNFPKENMCDVSGTYT